MKFFLPTRDKKANKWIHGAIPALLLHCSIGTVYCWSIFSQQIADYIGFPGKTGKGYVEWAFSIAIFFLGMSAAFLGNIVEKDIHKSSLISTIFFTSGMLLTGFFIFWGGKHPGSPISLIGIFLSYGVIMGIGLGTGYLSPVKTLMLWFQDKKGLATGLAVAGFGAAKAIASPIMEALLKGLSNYSHMNEAQFMNLEESARAGLYVHDGLVYDAANMPQMVSDGSGVWKLFLILACVYFVMMLGGFFLLAKPADWVEPQSVGEKPKIWEKLKTRPISNYIGIWLMFYINITCGLALISQEKMIVQCIGLGAFIGIISSCSAIFNAAGRVGYSSLGDKMKDRNTVYKLIFILSIFFTALVFFTQGIKNGKGNILLIIFVLALIMFINAGYGGGFSNLPTLLSDHYGMSNISAIHGITLSAWAFAGLTGNQVATKIVNSTGEFIDITDSAGKTVSVNPVGYQNVLIFVLALFVVALILCFTLVRPSGKAILLCSSILLPILLTGCFSNPGSEKISNFPIVETSETPALSLSEWDDEDWDVPDAAEYSASEGTLRKGNAVLYNGLVLFRQYGVAAISTYGMNGEFTFSDFPYDGSFLYTFDPDNPDKAPKMFCGDNGYGTLYLVGDTLFSNQAGDWGGKPVVYQRDLISEEFTAICNGTLEAFAPDGNTFVTSNYESDTGYDLKYAVRNTANPEKPLYEIAASVEDDDEYHMYQFLGMDNEHVYFAVDLNNFEEYLIIQYNSDGSYCILSHLPFDSGSNPIIQDYFSRVGDKIEFSVYFYDSDTGSFNGGELISVPVSNDGKRYTDSSTLDDSSMAESKPERTAINAETDPKSLDYKMLRKFTVAEPADGSGFASFIQYYETFPQGRFYAVSDAHRYPFGDFGNMLWYKQLQTHYMFLPEGENTPVEIGVTEDDYASTISAYVKFVGAPGSVPVSTLYQIIEITDVESKPEPDTHFYAAPFADDFVYEYNSENDVFSFTPGTMDDLVKQFGSANAYYTKILPPLFEGEGYGVSSDFDTDVAVMMYIGFNSKGEIDYMRPIVID
ncbi:MAG: OFA family MFS transporter [Lachnospiraceae bacterium]|nr:OFA family MFS transporter [Lachnospiraceae bacterium]